MEVKRQLAESLEACENQIKELIKQQEDYDAIELCLAVARQIRRIHEGLDQTLEVSEARLGFRPYMNRLHHAHLGAPVDPAFRYVVRGNELHRIGKRSGTEADYLQTVDERTFGMIVEATQRKLMMGDHRVRATLIHKELGRLPYYQVNLTISFLRDVGVLGDAQTRPEELHDLAMSAWEAHRQS